MCTCMRACVCLRVCVYTALVSFLPTAFEVELDDVRRRPVLGVEQEFPRDALCSLKTLGEGDFSRVWVHCWSEWYLLFSFQSCVVRDACIVVLGG